MAGNAVKTITEKPLDKMNKATLTELAASIGLQVPASWTKKQIAEAIRNAPPVGEQQGQQGQPGRPAGAGNIERPTVSATPARCPRCSGSTFKRLRGARPTVRQIDGVNAATGQPFRFVVWTRVVCSCGQHITVRTERMDDPRSPNAAD